MNTPVTKRKSSLPTPGRVSLNGEPNATPRTGRTARASLLPAPPTSALKPPSTPKEMKILQSSLAGSPNKLKKKTPKRTVSKLEPPSPKVLKSIKKCTGALAAETTLQLLSPSNKQSNTPHSIAHSVDDNTVKVDNSLTKQRSLIGNGTVSQTPIPKRASPRHGSTAAVVKPTRRSAGGILRNSSYHRATSNSTVLSLTLSASNSMDSKSDNEEAVKVCVRIRPISDCSWDQRAWTNIPSELAIVRTGPNNTDNTTYCFDNVYGEEASTQEVYDTMVQDIVSSVCQQGRNGTVFTYGQTSTGKTYTMHGIISAAANDIFNFSEEDRNKYDGKSLLTCVKVSCMELYNEELRDLLDRGSASSAGLGIKEDRKGNVQIPNLSERVVGSVDELLAVLLEADTNRTVGSTAMNERSSRSHTIFRITYEKKEAKEVGDRKKEKRRQSEVQPVSSPNNGDGVECTLEVYMENEDKENEVGKKPSKKMVTTVSTLNLVDLAGSESVRHTGATGDRQKEGGKINQSLLTLSTVLVKLGKKDPGHVNYRDSKLTRILKPSLSGNARMAAICCISPLIQYQEESKSTLDFASRTMLVTTNASRNETVEYDDAMVGEFEKEIERLKTETANAEKGQQQLALSLQESTEQIVCLMASIEIEKSKVANLEKQNYDFMMQVEELTLLNEELKTAEPPQSSCNDEALRKSIEELKAHNEYLERKMEQLADEKTQLEYRLMREVSKAEKRKDAALEKRKRFKNKLGDMKAKLRDDIAATSPTIKAESMKLM